MLKSLLYVIIALICLFTLIIFYKFQIIRVILGIAILLLISISGVISYAHLNAYYSAQGGVYGEITDLINSNKVEEEVVDSDVSFSLKNVVLTDDGEFYSLSLTKKEIIQLNPNQNYIIKVNDFPCDIITESIAEDNSYIIGRYSYVFYDRDMDGNVFKKSEDRMQIEFDFYKTGTLLKIFVFDGIHTNGLWNAYFNKNDFNITITSVDNVYDGAVGIR